MPPVEVVMPVHSLRVLVVLAAGLAWASVSEAQSLGSFTWQLQPYCNRLQLNVVGNAGVYTLDGFDDQCGGATRLPVVGLATPNPDGSVEFGLHLVAANGVPVQVTARIALTTLGGTWSDSQGATGAFTLGTSVAGAPRPLPSRVPAGSGVDGTNTSAGVMTLASVTSGIQNSAFGSSALASVTTGAGQTAMGFGALESATSGIRNSAVGYLASHATTTGSDNVAIGGRSLESNTTGSGNVAVGTSALASSSTTSNNVGVGISALNAATGPFNIAVGSFAARRTTSGAANTALGAEALTFNTTGSNNVALGDSAIRLSTVGNDNTGVGHHAGINLATGSANLFLGSTAGRDLTSGNNNIYLAHLGAATESGTLRIGTNGFTTRAFIAGISGATSSGGVAVFVNGQGQLGTVTSSQRFKDAIAGVGEDTLSRLRRLRPVEFVYRPGVDDGARTRQFGLIAEEVAEVFPELVVRNDDGSVQTVRYHFLAPLLLAEVQRLERDRATANAARDALDDRVVALETERRAHVDRLQALEQLVHTLSEAVVRR